MPAIASYCQLLPAIPSYCQLACQIETANLIEGYYSNYHPRGSDYSGCKLFEATHSNLGDVWDLSDLSWSH